VQRTNRQLLDEVKLGHDWAWRELVARYERLVMTVAMQCGLGRDDAEDCAQLSWLALYRNLDSIRNADGLGAWLFKTTHRNGMRLARRLAARRRYVDAEQMQDCDQYSEAEVSQLERQVHLQYAIDQLDDRCQKLLQALFFSPREDSYQAIARRLGISANSIGPTRYRCLKKLRHILEECGFL